MHELRLGVMLVFCFILLSSSIVPACGNSPRFVQISAAGQDCLALADDGSVWEWGSNWRGELTGNASDGHQAPIRVPISNVIAISAGGFQNLALKDDGTVWAWGALEGNLSNGTFIPVKVPIANVKAIYTGDLWSYALKNDGTLWSWGFNYNGQLGDGTHTSRPLPVQISLTNISYVDANGVFAVNDDGDVWAWGNNLYATWGEINYYGRLGDNLTNKSYPSPFKMVDLSGVSSISSGSVHVLVLLKNGSMIAWGLNDKGQLGNGHLSDPWTYENIPAFLSIDDVKMISAGREGSLALKSDGTVWTWGLEENRSVNPSPRKVPGLTDVIAISAGDTHYMALKSDGTVWVFGGVGRGQAGRATIEDYLYAPIRVDINFSSPASQAPINVSNQNIGQTPNTTASPKIGTTEIRILGVIGLIILLCGVAYLIKRK